MGLIAWWRGVRDGRRSALFFEAKWQVAVVQNAVTVTDAKCDSATLSLAELSIVAIETNDSGPWGADVWWLLSDVAGSMRAAWPQGAIDRLMALPGFDFEEMTQAMCSTDNATFIVWSADAK